MFQTFTCPSSGVLIYRLFHCRMWCYAIGVEAVVLRSWCVVLCIVCQLESNSLIFFRKIAAARLRVISKHRNSSMANGQILMLRQVVHTVVTVV